MTAVVVDASVVAAGLVDDSGVGRWAEQRLAEGGLVRPRGSPRPQSSVRGEAVAERVWELRGSITVHNAAYVAVAEAVEAPLVTLDRRLARSSGPRCSFLTPPDLG